MGNVRGVFFNSAWNLIGSVGGLLVTLITTPIYLRWLGLEQYGVLSIMLALTGPIGVLNAGVTQAAIKYIAAYLHQNELPRARAVIWASLLINVVMGGIGALVCSALAPWLVTSVFKVPPALQPDAALAIQLAGGVWFATQVGGTFRGAIAGMRNHRKLAMGDLANSLATAIACTSLLAWSPRVPSLVAGQLMVAILIGLFWAALARRDFRGLSAPWRLIQNEFSNVRDFSSWQMGNALVGTVADVADRYMVGILMSMATLGIYSVAVRVQAVTRILFQAVINALFPAASAVAGEPGETERLVVVYTWRVMLVSGTLIGGIMVVSPAFLRLWVGDAAGIPASPPLRLFLATLLLEIPSATVGVYLFARNLTRLVAYNNLVTSTLTVALMYPLWRIWGITGLAAGGLIGLALTRPWFHLWLHTRYFAGHVSRREYFLSLYGTAACIALASVATSLLFDRWSVHGAVWTGFLTALLGLVPYVMLLLGLVAFALRSKSHLHDLCLALARKGLPIGGVARLFA